MVFVAYAAGSKFPKVDMLILADLKNMLRAPSKYTVLLGVFYLVAHGGMLLIPNAIYWDDWVLYRVDPSVISGLFREAGAMFNIVGSLHVAMLEIGPWTYKIFTFLLMLAAGFLLNLILKRHVAISAETRFFIVLLFLVLPLNIARVALIDFPYTLNYFLFFSAWALLSRYRIAALALFFLSFNTNSLLVFYALPMIDFLYREGDFRSLKSFVFGISRKLDFVFLPLIYWYIKTVYFVPYGMYKGYNSNFSLDFLLNSYQAQWADFKSTVISNSGFLADTGAYVVLLFIIPCLIIFLAIRNRAETNKLLGNVYLVVIGVLAFIFGSLPYGLIGATGTFLEWTSRHQLLLPLGVSFFLVGLVSLLGKSVRVFVFSFIVALSLVVNTTNYIGFYSDWEKQKQLVALFKADPRIKNSGLIGFEDTTSSFNAIGRSYRFYEWNGLLKLAFGDELRFGIERSQFESVRDRKPLNPYNKFFSARYNAADYKNDGVRESLLVKIVNADTEDIHSNKGYWRQPLKLKLIVEKIDPRK